MNAMQKLREIVDGLKDPPDPMKVMDSWALSGRLLGRMPGIDGKEVTRICAERDIDALDAMVTRIEHPEAPKPVARPVGGDAEREVTEQEMRHAMKAFRKRLKLARLADESKLSGQKLSGGHLSDIDAIIPPNDYPWQVWDALAKAGQLDDTGEGFYALPVSERRKAPGP